MQAAGGSMQAAGGSTQQQEGASRQQEGARSSRREHAGSSDLVEPEEAQLASSECERMQGERMQADD